MHWSTIYWSYKRRWTISLDNNYVFVFLLFLWISGKGSKKSWKVTINATNKHRMCVCMFSICTLHSKESKRGGGSKTRINSRFHSPYTIHQTSCALFIIIILLPIKTRATQLISDIEQIKKEKFRIMKAICSNTIRFELIMKLFFVSN